MHMMKNARGIIDFPRAFLFNTPNMTIYKEERRWWGWQTSDAEKVEVGKEVFTGHSFWKYNAEIKQWFRILSPNQVGFFDSITYHYYESEPDVIKSPVRENDILEGERIDYTVVPSMIHWVFGCSVRYFYSQEEKQGEI